jgi:hypothetical protein
MLSAQRQIFSLPLIRLYAAYAAADSVSICIGRGQLFYRHKIEA